MSGSSSDIEIISAPVPPQSLHATRSTRTGTRSTSSLVASPAPSPVPARKKPVSKRTPIAAPAVAQPVASTSALPPSPSPPPPAPVPVSAVEAKLEREPVITPAPLSPVRSTGTPTLTDAPTSRGGSLAPSARPKARRIIRAPSLTEATGATLEGSASLSSMGESSTPVIVDAVGVTLVVVMKVDSEDEMDAFFNKRKVAAAYIMRRPKGKGRAIPVASSPPVSSSDDSSSDDNNPGRGDTSGPTYKALALPAWTQSRNKGLANGQSGAYLKALENRSKTGGNRKRRRMSVESSDDGLVEKMQEEEEDLSADEGSVVSEDGFDAKGKGKAREKDKGKGKSSRYGNGNGKKQRERSKSRSLTPPEQMDEAALAEAWAALKALEPEPVALPSPVRDNPINELDDYTHLAEESDSEEEQPLSEENDDEKIAIRVARVWDPRRVLPAAAADKIKKLFEAPTEFTSSPNSSFSRLFQFISEFSSIPKQSLIITYNNRRVYEFGSPSSLNLLDLFQTPEFKVYSQEIWDATQDIKRLEIAEKERKDHQAEEERQRALQSSPVANGAGLGANQHRDDSAEAELDPSLLKVFIRGSATSILPLAIKPKTLLSVLLKKYCKNFDVPPARMKCMWLEFDGDELDGKLRVEDYDEIEDEETIDVREGQVDKGYFK